MPAMKADIGSDIKLQPSDDVMALPPEFSQAGGLASFVRSDCCIAFAAKQTVPLGMEMSGLLDIMQS